MCGVVLGRRGLLVGDFELRGGGKLEALGLSEGHGDVGGHPVEVLVRVDGGVGGGVGLGGDGGVDEHDDGATTGGPDGAEDVGGRVGRVWRVLAMKNCRAERVATYHCGSGARPGGRCHFLPR